MVENADLTTPSWTGPKPSGTTPLGEGLVTADFVAAYLAVDVSCVYRMVLLWLAGLLDQSLRTHGGYPNIV